jgi:hypothetical protein
MPRHIIFYDLETRKLAQDLDPIDNRRGWDLMRQGKGGIYGLMIYDALERWLYPYDDNDILEIAAHLEVADVVVGWNSEGFDRPATEGLLGRKLVLKESLDLLLCVKEGLGRQGIHSWKRGQYTLGAVCQRTLGRTKTGEGKLAPQLPPGQMFRYCGNDVRLTRDLYEHILREGGIISVDGTVIPVDLPAYLKE